jgi:hypothetical protein
VNPFDWQYGGELSAPVDHVPGAALNRLLALRTRAATTEFNVNISASTRSNEGIAESRVALLSQRSAVATAAANGERLIGPRRRDRPEPRLARVAAACQGRRWERFR